MYSCYIIEYKRWTKRWYNKPQRRLYVGSSSNAWKRIRDHYTGLGAAATKKLGIKRIVAQQFFETREEALKEEKRLRNLIDKGWEPQEQPCSFIHPRNL